MNAAFRKIVFAAQLTLIAVFSHSIAQAQAGAIDQTFNGGVIQQPIRSVYVLKRQPDGKILVGGNFETAKCALRYGIVCLNTDYIVDQ